MNAWPGNRIQPLTQTVQAVDKQGNTQCYAVTGTAHESMTEAESGYDPPNVHPNP